MGSVQDGGNTAAGRPFGLDTDIAGEYHEVGAEVAQSVEHSTENAGVVSSILTLGTQQSAR